MDNSNKKHRKWLRCASFLLFVAVMLTFSSCGKQTSILEGSYSERKSKYVNKEIGLKWEKPEDLDAYSGTVVEVTVRDSYGYPQFAISDLQGATYGPTYAIALTIYDIESTKFPNDFVAGKEKTDLTAAEVANQLLLNRLPSDPAKRSLSDAQISEPTTKKVAGRSYAAQKLVVTHYEREGDTTQSWIALVRKVDHVFATILISYEGDSCDLAIQKAMEGFSKA